MIAARQPAGSWPVAIEDLRSRLRAATAVGIGPPDDALLSAVLVKLFADRQLRVGPQLIGYLLRNMERSFAAAADIASRLDQASLRDKTAITIPLARKLLLEEDS